MSYWMLATVLVQALSMTPAVESIEFSATGFITDTLCGRAGATAKHVDHAKRSVASGKAKYAIYDEKTKQLYILSCGAPTGSGNAAEDAACIQAYLGQRVTITGTLSEAAEKRAGEKSGGEGQVASGEKLTVHRHTPRVGNPLDTSTPIAGTLTIESISVAPKR